jgi:nitroreductase
MAEPDYIPLSTYQEIPSDEMAARASDFLAEMQRRRTVRHFSDRPVPMTVIENCVRTAMSAPSGANKQPWHFVVVTDQDLKRRIREEAEAQERAFYQGRAPEEWLEALEPYGTDEHKPYLETAPCLIAIFAQSYSYSPEGEKVKHYYVQESVGIATGMLITAIHHAGLVSLTHTPSPMGFLNEILGRPDYERPFLLLVVGYPVEGVEVPNITKKSLAQAATFL